MKLEDILFADIESMNDKEYLDWLLQQYLKEIPDITKEELKDLKDWVKSGHSPYENGDYICFEGGGPVDYVNAQRFLDDLAKEHEAELKNA